MNVEEHDCDMADCPYKIVLHNGRWWHKTRTGSLIDEVDVPNYSVFSDPGALLGYSRHSASPKTEPEP